MENAKELFVKAFLEAEGLDNAEIPSEDEIQWEFSEKFIKSMDRLVKKNNRIKFSTRRTVAKSLLAAIIAIIVLFTGLMSVAATRKPIIEFVKKVLSQFNEITLSENTIPPVETIQTEYTLTNLPEGYEISEYEKSDIGVFVVWVNESGEKIIFIQNILDSNVSIDNEHEYREIKINGLKAYLTEDEYGSELIWSDGYYCFTINVSGSIKNDITTLQENVSKKIE